MKKLTAPLFACGLLMAAGSASAQPTKGSGTFTLSGMVNTQIPKDGQDASAFGMFNLGIGKFVGSHTQISVGPTLNISAGGGLPGQSSVNASLGASVGVKQLFGGAASKTFPYVGLHATVLDFGSGSSAFGGDLDFDGDGLPDGGGSSGLLDKMLVGATVGFKSYVKESVALDLSAQMGAPARDLASGLRNVTLVAALEYIF